MADSTFILNTDAIDSRGVFDPRYTCDLDNSSPELRWMGTPSETMSFALVIRDLDTHSALDQQQGWIHWVIYNIPKDLNHLPAGIPAQESLPNGIRQGMNDFGRLGYAGPCPPSGDSAHRYSLELFALRAPIELPSRPQYSEFTLASRPLILVSTEILGKYQRFMRRAG
jgi:Raf kinase inhibitor-like YbhB/YbcL family protein